MLYPPRHPLLFSSPPPPPSSNSAAAAQNLAYSNPIPSPCAASARHQSHGTAAVVYLHRRQGVCSCASRGASTWCGAGAHGRGLLETVAPLRSRGSSILRRRPRRRRSGRRSCGARGGGHLCHAPSPGGPGVQETIFLFLRRRQARWEGYACRAPSPGGQQAIKEINFPFLRRRPACGEGYVRRARRRRRRALPGPASRWRG